MSPRPIDLYNEALTPASYKAATEGMTRPLTWARRRDRASVTIEPIVTGPTESAYARARRQASERRFGNGL